MNINELERNWNEFGRTDPLWSIRSLPGKKGNKWNPDDFFTTGSIEIDLVMQYVISLDMDMQFGSALDFGCGVGRNTQPLCRYFKSVHGVDISPSMIEKAIEFNKFGDACKYHQNSSDSLRLFKDGSFDFIYSTRVLQHMEPEYSKKYIEEFLRILRPGGVLIFQIPSSPDYRKVRKLLRLIAPETVYGIYVKARYRNKPRWDACGVKRDEVIGILERNGARIIAIKPDDCAGKYWKSFTYCVTKE